MTAIHSSFSQAWFQEAESFWITLLHQPVNKLSALYETSKYITIFTTTPTCHYPEPHQVRSRISNSFFIRPIIWSPHISVRFPNILSPSHFPTKTLYGPLHYSKSTTCQTRKNLINLITRIACIFKECRSWSSPLFNLLQPSQLLCPGTNKFLITLFSNTRNLYSSINVKETLWSGTFELLYFCKLKRK